MACSAAEFTEQQSAGSNTFDIAMSSEAIETGDERRLFCGGGCEQENMCGEDET